MLTRPVCCSALETSQRHSLSANGQPSLWRVVAQGRGAEPSELALEMDRSEQTDRNKIASLLKKVGVNATPNLTEVLSSFRSIVPTQASLEGETATRN